MPYTPIVATLGYVLSPDRSHVLMIHRNTRADDQHLGKYNGLGGKIAGAAQVHRGGAVLHHVTMAYDIDAEKMVDVLRIGREKLSDKGTLSAAKRVDPLRSQTGLPRAAVIERMIATFRRLHGLHDDKLRLPEITAAQELAQRKFASIAWTADVP